MIRSLLLAGTLTACGGEPRRDAGSSPPARSTEGLPGSVFAKGPGVLVTLAEVRDRVRRTGESPVDAAHALLEEALLAAAAERAGLDRDAEARRARRQVLVQRLLAEEVERRVTPETIARTDVEAAYRKNRGRWVHGEHVRVEHFLARLEKNAAPDAVEKARGLAETVLAAARAAPDRPLESHRAMLPAGASIKLESLPPFGAHSIYDPLFEAPALALRAPDDLSDVVRTSFGWHVIRLLERIPAENRPLSDVEPEIRASLVPEMRKRRLQALIGELGERRGVTVDPRPLAVLR